MAARNAECGLLRKVAEFRKKAALDIGTKTGGIGTADIFTHLVVLARDLPQRSELLLVQLN